MRVYVFHLIIHAWGLVKQIGHAILTLNLPNGEKETYLITLPRLVIAGLLLGSPYIELSQTSYIASSTGYVSTVSYTDALSPYV